MKAVALFLLRLVTGLYLLAWSAMKLIDTGSAIRISDELYGGLFSNPVVQHGLGALGGVLGLFVILGFLRGFTYLAQALVLALGVGVLAKTHAAPVDLAGGIDLTTALVPYLALFVAAVVPLLAKADDFLSLDVFLDWAGRRLARDEKAALAVTAAAAEAASVVAEEAEPYAEPVYEEPVYEEPVYEEPATDQAAVDHVEAEEVHAEPVAEEIHAEAAAEEVPVEAPVIEEAAAEEPAPEELAAEAPPAEEPVVEAQAEPVHVEAAVEEAPAVEAPAVEEAAHEEHAEAEPALEELAAIEAQKHEAPAPTVH